MTTTRRVLCTFALAATALVLAAPGRAAVVEAGPLTATFGGTSGFDPTGQRALVFDSSLGTLNTVTLAFDGTVSATLAARTADPAPYPSSVGADVTVYYTAASGLPPFVGLVPLTLPLTVSPGDGAAIASASGSAAQAFQLAIPAAAYGGGALYTDLRFTGLNIYGLGTGTDAVFTGTVTALFVYAPSGSASGPVGVPEPAGLALVGVGLAGLIAARRSRT